MPIPPTAVRILNAYWRAFGPYTPQIILIAVLAITSSVLEGLGITAIMPVFAFVGGGSGASLPTDTISTLIADGYHVFGIAYSFRNLLVGIAILFLARTILLSIFQYVTGRIVYSYERNTRRELFSWMLGAQWPYLSRQNMGNMEQLLTTNIMYSSQVFLNISTTILIATKSIIYLVIAINVSTWAAFLSVVVGAIVFLLLRPLFYRTRQIGVQAEANNRALAHFVAEHVVGMKALKATAVEHQVDAAGEGYFERVRLFNTNMMFLRSVIQMTIQFAGLLFIGVVFFIMYRSPGFSLAAFAVVVYAINQIFAQVQMGQTQLHGFGSMTPYLMQVMATRDEAVRNAEEISGSNPFSLDRALELADISFSYPDRPPTLSKVSFSLRHGEMLALIGHSGAGKTTVADLVLRLIEPSGGTMTVDGVDIRSIPLSIWRGGIGYVPQDPILLNDTIERNIRFYDEKISHEDIVDAAKSANIHEFIETLPQKYETVVGDRGVLISGGQRQRIALARALARKPKLLVLDEATSSLDSESELAIKQSVENLRGKTTTLVIAHRMSSISSADHVVVLEKGIVVESGTPATLREDPESYFSRMMRSGMSDMLK